MLAGLERPTSGTIAFDDVPVQARSPQERNVAMVFEQNALYPHMTARQNISYPLKIRGLSKGEIETKVADVATMLNIAHLVDRRASQMSGGQQQRGGIARAVAMEPKVLLLDEITSALDPELVGEVLAVVQELATEGRTMILVTHEMAFARDVADRVVFTDQGRIVIDAPPAKVFGEQPHERLRSFLSRFAGFRPNPA